MLFPGTVIMNPNVPKQKNSVSVVILGFFVNIVKVQEAIPNKFSLHMIKVSLEKSEGV